MAITLLSAVFLSQSQRKRRGIRAEKADNEATNLHANAELPDAFQSKERPNVADNTSPAL
jgi:hypothetical protein